MAPARIRVVHLANGPRLVASWHHVRDHLERRHAPLEIANRTHGTTPSRHATDSLTGTPSPGALAANTRGGGVLPRASSRSTVGPGYDSRRGFTTARPTKPVRSAWGGPRARRRSSAHNSPTSRSSSAERAGVVHHDGGDREPLLPGGLRPHSRLRLGPGHATLRGPAAPPGHAGARPPPRPRRTCPRDGSPPAAERRGR